MKKLLNLALASTLLATSAFANQGMFSVGLSGMADMERKERDSASNLELKSKTGASFEASVGYNVLDNVAVGLVLSYTVPTEHRKSVGAPVVDNASGVASTPLSGLTYTNLGYASVKNKVSASALYAKACAYLYDFGYGNVFASLGVGAGSLESKYTSTLSTIDSTDAAGLVNTVYTLNDFKVKSKTNAAFFGKFGAAFAVADDVHAMVFYSYANYGKTKDVTQAFTATASGAGSAATPTAPSVAANAPQVGKFRFERNSLGFGVAVGL
jgi:opacity protein-like surface antigen